MAVRNFANGQGNDQNVTIKVPIVDTKIDGHSYVQGHLNVGHQCVAMYVRVAYIFWN